MKLLILCPGKIPKSINDIYCFTDVINYYLPTALCKVVDCDIVNIPMCDGDELEKIFARDYNNYDAIVTLGLRFFSQISAETANILRNHYKGLICQVHDGTRLDYDPVDLTFTFKDDSKRLSINPGWHARHQKYNEYMGWAADSVINYPNQSKTDLRILVDHTNYGDNPEDYTEHVLNEIKNLIDSGIWKKQYNTVSVRRFDSGCVVDVDFDNVDIKQYDRTQSIPMSVLAKEHSAAHIFCVTHPESLGLVVLETATAGAFVVVPDSCVAQDRLDTVCHYTWSDTMDWEYILSAINVNESRKTAVKNSWGSMAKNIVSALEQRLNNESN
jgi:hypothetical protein